MIDKVTVYLSTYNGEAFLDEQIDSILRQEGVSVRLIVRDDGSSDRTIELLEKYRTMKGVTFYRGNNLGYAKSFLTTLKNDAGQESGYYAFSDQDDIWLPQKLKCGINKLKNFPQDIPLLYVSALQRVDGALNNLDKQDFPHLILSLGAEFTRHRLAGCTFVFNLQMKKLLEEAAVLSNLCSHDALATILCLSCGGRVIYDHDSYILFRRHGNNTSVDGKGTIFKIYHDVKNFLIKKHQHRDLARKLYHIMYSHLTPSSISFLQEASNYDKSIDKTIKFALNKKIGCGYWYYDFFVRIMIVMRYY